MSSGHTRREFLSDVSRGMLVASVGLGMATDLGLAPAWAEGTAEPLTFGAAEPLVALMQETPLDRLIPVLVGKLRAGTDLRALVEAAALANARTFGGEDYVGFHTMMALAPAFHMARELPEDRRALPVLKVLYRNTNRIREHGGRKSEVLHPVGPTSHSNQAPSGELLREMVRGKDLDEAERVFAALAQGGADEALNGLLHAVQDDTEVHRTVLPYRAWDLLGLIGKEQAHTLLRQSVRYCVKSEREWGHNDKARAVLPELIDRYHLVDRPPGRRVADDAWVESMSRTIFEGTPSQAADAVAAALADGIAPDSVGEAISLAANQLILRDHGRTAREAQAGKPIGSVHGDSIGVHACDSANAWRNMARVANPRNAVACLILGGYQVALDRVNRGGDFLHWPTQPLAEARDSVKAVAPEALLNETESAIKANDQARAAALIHTYGSHGHAERPVFDLLLRYAVSEDGALHAEKYYRTVSEEFATTRPAFRWRQLTALARVTTSEYGRPAPGYAEACDLLKI